VIAQSYERIHRSNLVGMGLLPLQFLPNGRPESRPHGKEVFEIAALTRAHGGIPAWQGAGGEGDAADGSRAIHGDRAHHTPQELHTIDRGILEYVLRTCLRSARSLALPSRFV